MRTGSLFSGYGGLDMAARQVFGGTVAWTSDNHPSAIATLAHHYPDAPNYGDITAIDWTTVPPVDILAAGFPCTDISPAGKRAGIEGEQSGLWRHVADATRVLRPRLVVLENVSAILVRGLDRVLADLAAIGYDVRWTCVRASDVGAPHRRDRWFAVAEDPDLAARGERWFAASGQAQGRGARADAGGRGGAPAPDADRDGLRQQPVAERGRRGAAVALVAGPDGAPADANRSGWGTDEHDVRPGQSDVAWGSYEPAIRRWESILGRPAPEPTVDGRRGNRVLNPVFVEWMMGLPAGHVTAVPGLSRNDQLRLLGNGVVPQQGAAALRHLITAAEARYAA